MGRAVIINGHPDADPSRFCHALADAYAEGAKSAGHVVHRIDVARADVPILRSRAEWEAAAPPSVQEAQRKLTAADHIVLIYPLWLGDLPALLKAFLEQVLRPGFALTGEEGALPTGMLKGKSARVVVTMGMPAPIYQWFFGAHSLRSLRRNILRFVGIKPVRSTVIGSVDASAEARARWLARMRALGRYLR